MLWSFKKGLIHLFIPCVPSFLYRLVRLKPKFEKEPPFAITCALYDIIPPNKVSHARNLNWSFS